jgi:hypothetical protein
MFTYYNNQAIRKLVIGVGSLFNNIHILTVNTQYQYNQKIRNVFHRLHRRIYNSNNSGWGVALVSIKMVGTMSLMMILIVIVKMVIKMMMAMTFIKMMIMMRNMV